MGAETQARQSRKKELLLELAELMIEEEGVFLGTPHYSIIELAAVPRLALRAKNHTNNNSRIS